ncbi:hypothetical protein [Neobacillus soli]|uniref:hypothetical protein n=1 Tax=Neobacillus soli TaxID=220688 RepID=UPI000826A1B0|nr:hypothetical protein [Neobacillus soli]
MFSNLGGSLFASEGGLIIFTFLPIILYLVLTGFGIYFVVKVILFMKAKLKLDQERNEKIGELIKVVSQGKREE